MNNREEADTAPQGLPAVSTARPTHRQFLGKGIPLDVYRGPYDGTLDGITSTHHHLTLIAFYDTTKAVPDVVRITEWQIAEFTADAPPVALVIRTVFGARYAHLTPLTFTPHDQLDWYDLRKGSHGGNFAGTTDPRFREVVTTLLGYPAPNVLAVHDRYEH